MIEHCDRCLTAAPPWESSEYGEWHLGTDADGLYLGVICPGCFASEGLAFIWAEAHVTPVEECGAERLTVLASGARDRARRPSSSAARQMRTAA